MQLPSSDIILRPMTLADIPLGMKLKKLADWNQLEQDWAFLIKAGAGGNFVALYKGEEAGTVTTLFYQDRFSWIGMVLVDPEFRGLGIGTTLLERAIDHAANQGTIRLDATPKGQKLYETMGFQQERELVRLQRPAFNPLPAPGREVKLLTPAILSRLPVLDTPVFGADRLPVLRYLYDSAPQYARYIMQDREITGYCLGRAGSTFDQIGPVIAHSPEDARALILTALAAAPHKAFVVDAPARNTPWLDFLQAIGFIIQRPLIRMYRGNLLYPGNPDQQFAIAGPELG
jgi:GNAT superfamily N-acetyltransferase